MRTLITDIGISRAALSRWLNGDITRPQCHHVIKCVKALHLTASKQAELLQAAGCQEFRLPPESVPVVGVPTLHPCQFFGRENVLRRCYCAWNRTTVLQSMAVIGRRKSGKTSLLCYLNNVAQVPKQHLRLDQPKGWPNGWLPHDFQFAMISFKDVELTTPQAFMRAILKQLHLDGLRDYDLICFSRILQRQAKPTVILIDDIDIALKNPQFDRQFWQQMHFILESGSQGRLSWVVTATPDALTSGEQAQFLNGFRLIFLEALTLKEAEELLTYSPIAFKHQDKDWILTQSECWPVSVQLLCCERLLALEEQRLDEHWKIEGLKRLSSLGYLNC